MIQLRIRQSRRTFQCDVAGCRNKTHYLITKRDDVCSHPLHLCSTCIRGLADILDGIEGIEGANLPAKVEEATAEPIQKTAEEPAKETETEAAKPAQRRTKQRRETAENNK